MAGPPMQSGVAMHDLLKWGHRKCPCLGRVGLLGPCPAVGVTHIAQLWVVWPAVGMPWEACRTNTVWPWHAGLGGAALTSRPTVGRDGEMTN